MKRWLIPAALLALVIAAIPALTHGVEPGYAVGKERAPIEGVSVVVMESFPPQYAVQVRYGLPSGCAQPGGYEVQRQGRSIDVAVYILVPTDPDVACTMIYGIDEVTVMLGSDFEPGETYSVDVNGTIVTFTAQ